MSEEIRKRRLEKLEALRALSIEPFGKKFAEKVPIGDVRAGGKEEGRKIRVAGRITAVRGHGKATFMDIKDSSGKIQVYFKEEPLGAKTYSLLQHLDIGDIIGVEGSSFKTRTGELTILVSDFTILSKALRPLPEKWHGLKDTELRFRRRYLDLISGEKTLATFLARSRVIKFIRGFLEERSFVEVETPMMQPIAGGAAARPFITHNQALDLDLYLRIAPELYLKRLLVGGMERVYEINRNFRNEGISSRHNPEFTMLELYQAYADYEDMVELTEALIYALAQDLGLGERFTYDDKEINLVRPWKRETFSQLFNKFTGVDIDDEKKVMKKAQELKVPTEGKTHYEVANDIFEAVVAPQLTSPTFVLDYPKAISPLTKAKEDAPHLTERFELYLGRLEIANAYTELNDPLEQRERFLEQLEMREDKEAGWVRELDEDFLLALEHGMPPAGGLGIGIDRLVMVLTGHTSIREVILFPLLRPEKINHGNTEFTKTQKK